MGSISIQIVIIFGFGYWAERIIKAISDSSPYPVYLITSRNITEAPTVLTNKGLSHITVLSPAEYSSISVDLIPNIFKAFFLCGPFDFYSNLNLYRPIFDYLPPFSIWLEKPLYTDEYQISQLAEFKDKVFVNYPYSHSTSTDLLLDIINSHDYRLAEINLFSKYAYKRQHTIHHDFLPHIFTICSLCGITLNQSLDTFTTYLQHSEDLFSLAVPRNIGLPDQSETVTITYGISSAHLFDNKLVFSTNKGSPPIEINFNHAFLANPVNYNIMSFLASSLPMTTFCTSSKIHTDVFHYSSLVQTRFM